MSTSFIYGIDLKDYDYEILTADKLEKHYNWDVWNGKKKNKEPGVVYSDLRDLICEGL